MAADPGKEITLLQARRERNGSAMQVRESAACAPQSKSCLCYLWVRLLAREARRVLLGVLPFYKKFLHHISKLHLHAKRSDVAKLNTPTDYVPLTSTILCTYVPLRAGTPSRADK